MGSSALVRTDQATLDTVVNAAAMLSMVKSELPTITDVSKVLGLRAAASAMQVFLKQRDAALGAQNDAAEIKLRTERRIGELTREIKPIPREVTGAMARGKGVPEAGTPSRLETLKDLGIERRRANEWEKLADVPADAFEKHVATVRAKGENVSSAKAAVFSSESDEWYTPQKYIESARLVLGRIDLDPASNVKANEVVGAKAIYTIDDDGLAKPWKGRIWLNPPYGDHGETNIATWIGKMISEYRAGRMQRGILLVNASTDRKWFQPLWDFPICFTDHRIEFYTPSGTPRSPVSGNVFVYMGGDVTGFASEFAKHGPVVRRIV